MRIRRFAMVIASASLILGLGGLVLAYTAASAQTAPTLKLSGGKPKPCSVRKGPITAGGSGRFTVKALIISLGTVGDGSCSAPGSPPKCYVQASGGGETVRV